MPPKDRDWRFRIEDMLEAIQRIQEYTRGLDLGAFIADRKTIDAVVRNFEILGEAARHVPQNIEKGHATIPWSKIRGMRHLLSHEYFGVSEEILWRTATQDLPQLVSRLRAILADNESGQSR